MRIDVVFDDGRASTHLDTAPMTGQEPYRWDGRRRAATMAAAPGWPPPESSCLAARAMVRQDLFETEGVRVDVTWYNTACAEGTAEAGSYRPGVGIPVATQEVCRTMQLVSPADIAHVAEIHVDGRVRWVRRFGQLCDLSRRDAAVAEVASRMTAVSSALVAGLAPGVATGKTSTAHEVALHELLRHAYPEWRLDAAGPAGGPVWDEAAIAAAHGMPEAAWWRVAALDVAEGGFYTAVADAYGQDLARELVLVHVIGPAVGWYRAMHGEDATPSACARFLSLSDGAAGGLAGFFDITDAWEGRAPDGLGDTERRWLLAVRSMVGETGPERNARG